MAPSDFICSVLDSWRNLWIALKWAFGQVGNLRKGHTVHTVLSHLRNWCSSIVLNHRFLTSFHRVRPVPTSYETGYPCLMPVSRRMAVFFGMEYDSDFLATNKHSTFTVFFFHKKSYIQGKDVWRWIFHGNYIGPLVHCLVRDSPWQVLEHSQGGIFKS